ncbi:hypothetical protein [Pseudonocardia sp. TRM90224]|uniref:hypothetical protein n=1 Tax=Pseudonocardia sp. TRM90224 TaxID=2812678 RepID=UPI001E29EB1D|nr:hypothetical protein [Pseudonocardia sp. TRM90224]
MPELPADVAAAFRSATNSLARFLKERSEDSRAACLQDHETMLAKIQAAAAAEDARLDWTAHRFHAEAVIETVSQLGTRSG